MPLLGQDSTLLALEVLGHLRFFPSTTDAAKAAQLLASCLKITTIGAAAGNALATAVTASLVARPLAGRPATGDATKNAAHRACTHFAFSGLLRMADILDPMPQDEIQALQTALATRAT